MTDEKETEEELGQLQMYEPQVFGVNDGELVILDALEFGEVFDCYAVSWRDGSMFVLDRNTKEWRVIAPYKETKSKAKLSAVKPAPKSE